MLKKNNRQVKDLFLFYIFERRFCSVAINYSQQKYFVYFFPLLVLLFFQTHTPM